MESKENTAAITETWLPLSMCGFMAAALLVSVRRRFSCVGVAHTVANRTTAYQYEREYRRDYGIFVHTPAEGLASVIMYVARSYYYY